MKDTVLSMFLMVLEPVNGGKTGCEAVALTITFNSFFLLPKLRLDQISHSFENSSLYNIISMIRKYDLIKQGGLWMKNA